MKLLKNICLKVQIGYITLTNYSWKNLLQININHTLYVMKSNVQLKINHTFL